MEKKQSFLKAVTEQIQSKEAKSFVSRELDHHLTNTKLEYMQKGLSEETAENKAIEQMGSPLKLGAQLNKIHRPKIDWVTITLFGLLLAAGFLPLFTLSYLDDTNFSATKIKYTCIGIFTALLLMRIQYRTFLKHGMTFYAIGIMILLCINLFPTTTVRGIPIISIPPIPTIESMFTLPFFYFAWAALFSNKNFHTLHFSILFIPSFLLFLLAGNKGACMIYVFMVLVMLSWSRLNRRHIIKIYAGSVAAFSIFITFLWHFSKPYQKERIFAFLNPDKYADTVGYQSMRVKELLTNAGLFGHPSMTDFIPEAHTDLAFVSITYHYGWIAGIVLLVILAFIFVRMLQLNSKITEPFGRLLLIGATTIYCTQLLYNIGMSFGLFPMTMISLPFISFGFMPTLLNSCLIGIVLSVYRRKHLTPSF